VRKQSDVVLSSKVCGTVVPVQCQNWGFASRSGVFNAFLGFLLTIRVLKICKRRGDLILILNFLFLVSSFIVLFYLRVLVFSVTDEQATDTG